MARHAASWRLLACSDAAVEQPLLAKMTEFWFNHLNVFVGKAITRLFMGHYVINAARAHAPGRLIGNPVNGNQWHGQWTGLARGNLNESRDLPADRDYRAVLAQVFNRSFAMSDVG